VLQQIQGFISVKESIINFKKIGMKNIKLILLVSILTVLCLASCETKSISEENQELETLQRTLNNTVGEDVGNEDDEDSEGD
tara:strand:- start:94 stop:339 length:246 start_codon:yes stop_codon:yes gene_type:complete